MKKLIFVIIAIALLALPVSGFAEQETTAADFDNGQAVNNLGGNIEVWLAGDGSDATQFSKMSFVADDAVGNPEGKSLKIDYDVESENPAYNGVRMDLNNFDTTGYKEVEFYVKGDAAAGFTKTVKIELIGESGRPSPYMVNGITGEWQEIEIPLSEFPMIHDGSKLQKFVVVFADITSAPKTGTIYIDHVHFSKS